MHLLLVDAGVPSDWPQLSLRWTHFVAGVLWIGLLYFFNWVNSAFVPTLDPETKRKVIPELMPRALFWFRWGAAFTWLTGVALAMILYYSGRYGYLLKTGVKPELMDWLPAFLGLVVGFVVYDVMFKLLGKNPAGHSAAVLIWGALAIGFGCILDASYDFSGRAVFVHLGALFGTAMAANVWMRIWPAQRRIITAIKAGTAPNPADVSMAGLRSKHNTYMSVPLLLFMVSVDQPGLTALVSADGGGQWQLTVAGIFVIGWVATYLIYKSAPKVKGF
ncbi:MAG TPA: urate hydroxylase PuuD [Planctomycetota bacterium]|nr:urate hydroxylase PuuD [Planctomycetota bacterium]